LGHAKYAMPTGVLAMRLTEIFFSISFHLSANFFETYDR
jgi:hypothetical protein